MRRALVAVVAVVGCTFWLTPPAAAGDALDQLAARYAPVVRLSEQDAPCARGESFEPINVDAIFENDEVALRGPWSGANLVMVGPRAADLSSGRYGYALDFPGPSRESALRLVLRPQHAVRQRSGTRANR